MKPKALCLSLFALIFFIGCAQTIRQDDVIIGRPASTNDKCLTFDTSTADGQRTVCIDDTTGDMTIQGSNTGTVGMRLNQVSTGDTTVCMRLNDSASNEWCLIADNSNNDRLEVSYNAVVELIKQSGANPWVFKGGIDVESADSGGGPIVIETYTGTVCTYTAGTCTTDIDTAAPGTNPPFSISCVVKIASSTRHDVITGTFGDVGDSGGNIPCGYVYWDSSSDDIEMKTTGSGSCTDGGYSGQPYYCIAFAHTS